MRRAVLLLALAALILPRLAAAADRPGDFAYYVLALSWSPTWCETTRDARGAEQCESERETGFILHGLWPQHVDGWPEYCATRHRDPTRAETAAMADIMGSDGLAWHAWKKHGRCSGLGPQAYYALSRRAFEAVRRPEALREAEEGLRAAPGAIEGAFVGANPALTPESVTVTCRDGLFREVRICLTRDLAPRPCTGPAARACPARTIVVPPVR